MTPELWKQVKSVLESCLDLPAARRTAYLDLACAGQPGVRAEVESLLSSHDRAGDFIERPAMAAIETGARLGPWELFEEVGHGGMGRIYRGKRADGLYEKEVAVKILKRGVDTDAVVRHFEAERQILASLDHPNIAGLLDGGVTADGRPFLVMEFIRGVSIDRYLEDHALSIRDSLALFRQVCAAVHYAHQRLVVHRDIKPSNILVTDDGVPKLLDFGIAKILSPDANQQTLTAAGMMTPDYASPEQLRGDPITTATDVYSLGVLLYRLLTGRRPNHTATPETPVAPSGSTSTADVIPPSQAAGPSTELRSGAQAELRRALRGDLDNIVLKSLEKDAARRYASVEQFSDDLQRYLEGRPVLARKPTLAYRAARFVRRNMAAVVAAALLVVALLGGLIATTWQYRIAQLERRRAEQRFDKLRSLAHSVLFELHDSIGDLPGSTAARALMVTRGLEYLDGLAAEHSGDPSLQRELAEAYIRVGDVQGRAGQPNLGQFEKSKESYRKALRILETDPSLSPKILGETYTRLGGLENALKALQIFKAIYEKNPNDRKSKGLLSTGYYSVADAYIQKGDFETALKFRREDLAIRKALYAEMPEDKSEIHNYALLNKRLGGLLARLNRLDEALTHYQLALELEEKQARIYPNSADAIMGQSFSHSDIGYILRLQNKLDQALLHYRRAVEIREAQSKADPSNYRARSALSSALWRTAGVLVKMQRFPEAMPLLHRALAVLEPNPVSQEKIRDHCEALNAMASAFFEQKDYSNSRLYYQRSRDLARNGGAPSLELLNRANEQLAALNKLR